MRAERALGSSQTISAISQPASTAFRIVGPSAPLIASCDAATSACCTGSGKMPAGVISAANTAAPPRLAASTIAHSRSTATNVARSRRVSSGSTAVSVLSVNNCWRPSTTIRKPTL